jgi:hypothetical protein
VEEAKDVGISKVRIALGAASLFLFLVGVKRSFKTDEGQEILSSGERAAADLAALEEAAAARRARTRVKVG